jgi:hypothetical protein
LKFLRKLFSKHSEPNYFGEKTAGIKQHYRLILYEIDSFDRLKTQTMLSYSSSVFLSKKDTINIMGIVSY